MMSSARLFALPLGCWHKPGFISGSTRTTGSRPLGILRPVTSTIDAYVAELDAALLGPRRAKIDLLTEARDSLVDAAEAFESGGTDRIRAEREAVREFGTLGEIVPGYQAELAIAQGRRTVLALLFVFLAQPFVWGYSFRWVTSSSAEDPRSGFQAIDDFVERLGMVTILASLVAVLAYRIGMRYPAIRERIARTTAIFALAMCVAFAILGSLLTLISIKPNTSVLLVQLVWTVAFVLIPVFLIALSARRCLRMALPVSEPR
jgi:hypothetical protein